MVRPGPIFACAQAPTGLAQDFCAVAIISFGNALVLPVSPAAIPRFHHSGLAWLSVAIVFASRDHFISTARGPPTSDHGLNGCIGDSIAQCAVLIVGTPGGWPRQYPPPPISRASTKSTIAMTQLVPFRHWVSWNDFSSQVSP